MFSCENLYYIFASLKSTICKVWRQIYLNNGVPLLLYLTPDNYVLKSFGVFSRENSVLSVIPCYITCIAHKLNCAPQKIVSLAFDEE